MAVKKLCNISEMRKLTSDIFSFRLDAGEIAEQARPGQFVHIKCGEGLLLRRPISICDAGDGLLRIVFQVRGTGTQWLAERKVGEALDVLGPLGNGFQLPESGKVLLAGGGIGTAPLLFAAKSAPEGVVAALGFRTGKGSILVEDFRQAGVAVEVATEDGTLGVPGTVDQVIRRCLQEGTYSAVLACGPTPMLRAISRVTAGEGTPCQVSLEERMACGIGACLTCSCKVNGHYRRVCKDGPVFPSEEVEWDE